MSDAWTDTQNEFGLVSYNKLSSFSYDARVLTLSLDAIVHSPVVVYTRTAIKNCEIPGKI